MLETREVLWGVWILVLVMLGVLLNYTWFKADKRAKITMSGLTRKLIIGLVAGLLLVWYLDVSELSYTHNTVIPIALMWGISAETIVGKVLGLKDKKRMWRK